jgi:hypothetical protein
MIFSSNKSPVVRVGAFGAFAFSALLSFAVFGSPKGQPFIEMQDALQGLDARIDSLAEALDGVLSSGIPVDVAVDCAAGEQISPLLAQYQNGQAPLNFIISGICNESVRITRDNVSLRAAEPGACIVSATEFGAVTATRGADNIVVEGLSLVGTQYGAIAAGGSQVRFIGVDIAAAKAEQGVGAGCCVARSR